MYNPHTVSLVTVTEGRDGTTEQAVTYLEGVFLDDSHGTMVNKSRLDVNMVGLYPKDEATLYIPLKQVKATDAETGKLKKYCEVYEYDQKEDKENYWTAFPGGKISSRDCFFVKGKVNPSTMLDYAAMNRAGMPVYHTSSVIMRDYGISIDPYLQVGGQ